jgi:16S rRNA (guanine(527)-N(7))-methyltransferase RsmG
MSADAELAVRAGLESHELDATQREKLVRMLELLATDEHAPTAVREPRLAVQVHLADSLAALELDVVRAAAQIADLGSGAGFPGLALAVALPDTHVSLIESQRRSSEFLARVCAGVGIENAGVVWTRAEDWREGLSRNDVVVARALAPQPVVLEYAAPLLRRACRLARQAHGQRGGGSGTRVSVVGDVSRGGPPRRAVRAGKGPPPTRVHEG